MAAISRLLAAFALLVSFAACLAQPRTDLQADIGIDQKLNSQLPLGATFIDESGKDVKLGEYFKDRPVIVALVYYQCPKLCNEILNGILACLRVVKFDAGQDFDVVLVSINPLETPKLARAKKDTYVKSYNREGGEQGWHFLVGNKENIDKVATAVGYRYKYDENTKLYVHAAGIQVATPTGKLSQYFYETEYSPRDMQFALMTASKNKIGSVVDQVLLYCFVYDPSTGKYSLAILNVIRLFAMATAVVLGTFIFSTLRRERKPVSLTPVDPAKAGDN